MFKNKKSTKTDSCQEKQIHVQTQLGKYYIPGDFVDELSESFL